jgi:hypothetical protein
VTPTQLIDRIERDCGILAKCFIDHGYFGTAARVLCGVVNAFEDGSRGPSIRRRAEELESECEASAEAEGRPSP